MRAAHLDAHAYWNDERLEHGKPYCVDAAQSGRLTEYLERETNLRWCFDAALAFVDEHFGGIGRTVLDLGAGVCWTTALISRRPDVASVHALDYSSHRLEKVAPIVFRQLGAVQEKITRHCRDLSTLPFADESADAVVFCQALYMNDDPVAVLHEVRRVLRPGGAVIISCERGDTVPAWRASLIAARAIACQPHLVATWWRHGRVADVSGRFAYTERQYAAFVTEAKFRFVRQDLRFPLFPGGRSTTTANYFGVRSR